MRFLLLIVAVMFSGCVSIGVQCTSGTTNAWAKVRRVGFGVSAKQAENFATFREKVCR